ncbi:MAG: HalOD1 output domain-containing protein [Halobacteriota archaeon]
MAGKGDSTASKADEQFRSDTEPSPGTTDGGRSFSSQAHYEQTKSRDLTTVIVGGVADPDEVSITEVLSLPLYQVIDIAGMGTVLFGRLDVSVNGTESAVEFRYREYKVRVEADREGHS